jgi:hypothetical protein
MTPGNWARLLWIICIASWVFDLAWFDLSPARLRPWLLPQHVLSLAGLVVGFIVLSWQLERQHRNSLDANRRQSQDRLKVDIYNEIAKRLEAASAPLVDASMTPTAVVGELVIRLQNQMRSRHRPASLLALSTDANRAVTSLAAILETYEFVMPEFLLFRRKLAHAAQGLRVALGDFVPLAIPYVAVGTDGAPLRWPPTQLEMDEMSRLAGIARRAGADVSAVLYDLRIDAQNYLLGNLFGRQLPKRAPTDPSVEVTSITHTTSGARPT